jgi:RNA polymerase sigma-70 factor (ECF subfamily)
VRDGQLFETWAFTIARNAACDAWRRRGDARATETVDESLAAPTPSPERAAADRQRLDRLRQGLAELPSRMRACFLLRVQDELSYEEIGRRLALSPGTVKVQVWNSRRRLREMLR